MHKHSTFGMKQSPPEILAAKRVLYDLLAQLYLRPPDAALLDTFRTLPGIADYVSAEVADIEALQVEYEFIFGRNVYPYESLYIDHDLMLNTAATDRVAQLYGECGFSASIGQAGAPDHLGIELSLMKSLLGIEIAALSQQNQEILAWSHQQQARCLHEHLVRWSPICICAIKRITTHAFYRVIAQLTCDLILDDAGRISQPLAEPVLPPMPLAETDDEALLQLQPSPEQPADEEERGINRIVRRLITPDEVGVFLSRSDLSAIGRRSSLPVPIGERFQMMRGLFETAGQFELIASLLDALDALLAAEAAELRHLACDYPVWTDCAQHWLHRIALGSTFLGELRTQTLMFSDATRLRGALD